MKALAMVEKLKAGHSFGRLLQRVDQTLSPAIGAYRDSLPQHPLQTGVKAIKDAVWGMIDVEPSECVVLGSPPIQRLRYIRQLGLTYLTYPTAGYSRFEHTLGAVHQADRMFRAIAARSLSVNEKDFARLKKTVRLAALLHDVGHLPLSHVSERYFGEDECPDQELTSELMMLRNEVAETLQVSTPKLSECLSLGVALAPSFHDLLVKSAAYEVDVVAEAVGAIVGWTPLATGAFVAQIITNVIDADKLDYMFRDAFVTRVPLAVDLERLLSKLRCFHIDPKALPDLSPLRHRFAGAREVQVLGTDLAGQKLAFDLAISRTMLYQRVYLHHKTRAAERVALGILAVLRLGAIELLSHDDGLFTEYGSQCFPGLDDESRSRVRQLTKMLMQRQLPRRGFALSYQFLKEQIGTDLTGPALIDWFDLWDKLKSYDSRKAMEEAITREVSRLSAILQFNECDLQIWIDTPNASRAPEQNVPDLFILLPDETTRNLKSFGPEAAAFPNDPGQVFFVYVQGSQQARELVCLATELVLAREYPRLRFGRHSADYAKLDLRDIEAHKRELEKLTPDLFVDFGAIRPRSLVAREGLTHRIQALAERFQTYTSSIRLDLFSIRTILEMPLRDLATPITSCLEQAKVFDSKTLTRLFHELPRELTERFLTEYERVSRFQVNAARIRAFVDQFPEHLVEPMTSVLEHIMFLGRSVLENAFVDFLVRGTDETTMFVPLTEASHKSAIHLCYFLGARLGNRIQLRVKEALAREGNITFFDESILSGQQSSTVIQTLVGQPLDLPEENNLTVQLSADEYANLQKRQVRFRFLYGIRQGIDHTKTTAGAAKLGDDVAALSDEAGWTRSLANVPNQGSIGQLREFLRKVGTQLLLSTKMRENPAKWTEDRCQRDALGYGGLEQLLVFAYNTPAATLTALWKGGHFRNVQWLPLFPRREELSPLLTVHD